MLILTIRTDNPQAEIGLYNSDQQIAYETWEAHRQLGTTIHNKIKNLLKNQAKDWLDIEGVVGFKGPGSFTGLRIGLTVANALAYGVGVPIVSSDGEDWLQQGIERLLRGENEVVAMPEYGSDAHITLPKK